MDGVYYLDAWDVVNSCVCQIEIDADSAARERLRGLFSVTDSPRIACPIKPRNIYDWLPRKRDD